MAKERLVINLVKKGDGKKKDFKELSANIKPQLKIREGIETADEVRKVVSKIPEKK